MHLLWPIALWWLGLTLVGLAGLPFARLLLPTLPDRGLAVARPLGLLLVAFTWWWAVTVGLLPNSALGAWVALLVVAGVGLRLVWEEREEALAHLRRWRERALGLEALFLLALVAWALYRAFYPDVTQSGGEKTMELAFLYGIVESPRFPPNDPWMSGESISYYYLAYVMGAWLVRLTGLEPSVAFNLLVPGTLAMALCAAYGLGAGLVEVSAGATRRLARLVGLSAATLLALLGSLQGALEVGYRLGWPGRGFYRWLGVFDLGGSQAWADGALAESLPGACGKQDAVHNELARIAATHPGFQPRFLDLFPDRHIWWWRASRVIRDGCTEAIHEFPFFSFMLADAHPHVLALPFVLLVMTVALALLGGATAVWARSAEGGMRGIAWLLPLLVGSLAFLNTWDLPTYGALVILAYALHLARAPRPGPWPPMAALGARALVAVLAAVIAWRSAAPVAAALRRLVTGTPTEAPLPSQARLLLAGALALALWLAAERLREAAARHALAARGWALLRFTAWLAVTGWLLYVPFYLAFSSQASGIAQAPFSSRPAQWLVHWGLHYLLVLGAAAAAWRAAPSRAALLRAVFAASVALALPALAWPLDLTGPALFALVAASVALIFLPLPTPRGLLGGEWGAWSADHSRVCGPTRRFLQLAALVGVGAIARWRASAPDPLPPETAMGGAAGWTPWTPLLIALPLLLIAAAGLERWLAGSALLRDSDAEPWPAAGTGQEQEAAHAPGGRVGPSFAWLIVCLGLLMVLGTEFFYVRDIFNSRMNTIFKLYFQSWTLLSIGGAYALFAMRRHLPRAAVAPWLALVLLAAASASLYPLGATWDRTGGFAWPVLRGEGAGAWFQRLSLDGLRYWESAYPSDLAAARWLRENAEGTPYILEATGGGYSHTGRIAMATGLPTVLGSDGHELQWRGSREKIDPRKADVEAFYAGRMSEEQMDGMLDTYEVRFIVLGDWERAQHEVPRVVEERLTRLARPVFQEGGMTVYER